MRPNSVLASRPEVAVRYAAPISLGYLFTLTGDRWLVPLSLASLVGVVSIHTIHKKIYGYDLAEIGELGQEDYIRRFLSAVIGQKSPDGFELDSFRSVFDYISDISSVMGIFLLFNTVYLVLYWASIPIAISLLYLNISEIGFVGLGLLLILTAGILMKGFTQTWGDPRYVEQVEERYDYSDDDLNRKISNFLQVIANDDKISISDYEYSIAKGGQLSVEYTTKREIDGIEGEIIAACSGYAAFCNRCSYPQKMLNILVKTADGSTVSYSVTPDLVSDYYQNKITDHALLEELQQSTEGSQGEFAVSDDNNTDI